jgi:hypothetical protein
MGAGENPVEGSGVLGAEPLGEGVAEKTQGFGVRGRLPPLPLIYSPLPTPYSPSSLVRYYFIGDNYEFIGVAGDF